MIRKVSLREQFDQDSSRTVSLQDVDYITFLEKRVLSQESVIMDVLDGETESDIASWGLTESEAKKAVDMKDDLFSTYTQ